MQKTTKKACFSVVFCKMLHQVRREGDSNPRSAVKRTTVFETAAFNRSAISPVSYSPSVKGRAK